MTKRYYHISQKLLSDTTLKPRIPDSISSVEDYETPRVCLATSIQGCIMATEFCYGTGLGDMFYVYAYDSDTRLYRPTKDEVPDVDVTGERWCTSPVTMKLHSRIQIVDRGKHIPFLIENDKFYLQEFKFRTLSHY